VESNETSEKFEAWGLLELFDHQRLAGQLSEQTVGGVHFIRIDVPPVDGAAAYTRFFTQGAIYGMTVLSEQVARAMANTLRAKPVQAYEVQALEHSGLQQHTYSYQDDPERANG